MSVVSNFLSNVSQSWITNLVKKTIVSAGEQGINIYVAFKTIGKWIVNVSVSDTNREIASEGISVFIALDGLVLRIVIKPNEE